MCGIAAVYAPGLDVARLVYFGLYALQHRGQESAGIAVGDGERLASHREMGLLTGVFNEEILGRLNGHAGIGHTRYSTSGSSVIVNAQPFLEETDIGPFAFGHNGNLTNADALLAALPPAVELDATSDSEILAKTIALGTGPTLIDRVKSAMAVAEGAYSVVMVTPDSIVAFRDPWGVRPLCIGTYGDNGYMVASESCALATVGAQYLREIEAGEIVVVDRNGMRSEHIETVKPPALCMFEYIYFARPDSVMEGTAVYAARKRIGEELARESGVPADVIVPVPDSGVPAAMGYAAESGIPFELGIIRNHYVGRTFIEPTDHIRNLGVKLKHSANRPVLAGKRVVLVDDSIVRGTTSRKIVEMVRAAGAREVHMRISSPPTTNSCFYGIDTPERSKLLAARYSIDEMARQIGADSLAFVSIDGLYRALGKAARDPAAPSYCDACFTGDYPIPLPDQGDNSDRQLSLLSEEN